MKMPNDKYVVMAVGSDAADKTVVFFSVTPHIPENEARTFLEWLKIGPKLKWAIECQLYKNSEVKHINYYLEKI